MRARLEERAEIAELVFHRPLDRVAVELRAVVDTRPPNSGWDVIRNVPTGEGHYYELFDRTGHRLSYGGHSARMLSGGGSAARFTLPFEVSGSVSSNTNTAGTM